MLMAKSKLTGNWLVKRGKPPYHTDQLNASLFESEESIKEFLHNNLHLPLDSHELYTVTLEKVENGEGSKSEETA